MLLLDKHGNIRFTRSLTYHNNVYACAREFQKHLGCDTDSPCHPCARKGNKGNVTNRCYSFDEISVITDGFDYSCACAAWIKSVLDPYWDPLSYSRFYCFWMYN